MQVGQIIRQKRQSMGLTQTQLAERSGVSKAMLCDVEADRKNPTIRLLGQIAFGLGVGISELLDLEEQPTISPDLKKDQRVLVDPENGMERRVLSRAMIKRGVEVIHYVYPPGTGCGGFPPHPPGTLETCYVVEGRIRQMAGSEAIELGPGDAVTYKADVEHFAENIGETPARVVYVTQIPRQER